MKNTHISLASACLALACLSAPAFAGGGKLPPPKVVFGPPATPAPGVVVALQPNYSARLDHHLMWRYLPVRVYFLHDKNYSAELEQIARDGFDHWTKATSGFVKYAVTQVWQRADIFVRFDPDLNGGLTKTHFRKGILFRADMTVGVARDVDDDILCTAAHEFGHALGIDGHSDERSDLMFPVHVMGRGFRVTERDVNTLAISYPELAKRLAARADARTVSMQNGMQ